MKKKSWANQFIHFVTWLFQKCIHPQKLGLTVQKKRSCISIGFIEKSVFGSLPFVLRPRYDEQRIQYAFLYINLSWCQHLLVPLCDFDLSKCILADEFQPGPGRRSLLSKSREKYTVLWHVYENNKRSGEWMKFYGGVPKALSVKIHSGQFFSQEELNKKQDRKNWPEDSAFMSGTMDLSHSIKDETISLLVPRAILFLVPGK